MFYLATLCLCLVRAGPLWLASLGGPYVCGSSVTQLCLTLCNLMDYSPPGSSAHGIFQARVLEWVAIAFSNELNMELYTL